MARLRNKRNAATKTRAPATPEERRRQTFQRAAKLLSAKSRSIAELRDIIDEFFELSTAGDACLDGNNAPATL